MFTTNLCRLVYFSRSNIEGTPGDVAAELADILSRAQGRNAASEVTGVLLTTRTSFAQLIEGRPADIRDTYKRIFDDKRHRSLRLIVLEPIVTRRFGDWAMEHVQLSLIHI